MPSINRLNDQKCRAARPRERAYKLFDGASLYLYVSPKGAKIWRWQYRIAGKQQTLTIGAYPRISLRDARERRDTARTALEAGEDPAAPKKAASGRGMTLTQAAQAYWAGREDVSDIYRTNATRALAMHVEPTLGVRPIASITREDVMGVLSTMNGAGLYVYVRKVRRWASQVFDWAIEHGHARVNPCQAIRPEKAFGRRPVQHHASLPLAEVGGFLRRLALEPPVLSHQACLLLLLTWARTDELRGMRWDEIEGDLWRIPGPRMKRRIEHLVPLSRQAIALLEALRARRVSEFVFPNDRRLDRSMSENSVLYLIGRIGYGGRLTGHGFRTMGSTWANEAGFNADAIERQLAHAPEDAIRAVYNQAQYLPERRKILQAWADWLDRERRSQPS